MTESYVAITGVLFCLVFIGAMVAMVKSTLEPELLLRISGVQAVVDWFQDREDRQRSRAELIRSARNLAQYDFTNPQPAEGVALSYQEEVYLDRAADSMRSEKDIKLFTETYAARMDELLERNRMVLTLEAVFSQDRERYRRALASYDEARQEINQEKNDRDQARRRTRPSRPKERHEDHNER